MALEQKLENIVGNLKDAYKQAVPGTVLCVDQLMDERRTNTELRNLWFYTADGEVYSLDDGKPTLRITREAVNPVLNHIDDAFEQLVHQNNYQVTPADFEAVKTALDTVVIDLTALRLFGDNDEWHYLAIDTKKGHQELNEEESKLATRYGYTPENLATLKEAGISKTEIYVLSPNYVKNRAKDGPIGRASWLTIVNSYFGAYSRDINGSNRLHGVRRERVVAEKMTRKNR